MALQRLSTNNCETSRGFSLNRLRAVTLSRRLSCIAKTMCIHQECRMDCTSKKSPPLSSSKYWCVKFTSRCRRENTCPCDDQSLFRIIILTARTVEDLNHKHVCGPCMGNCGRKNGILSALMNHSYSYRLTGLNLISCGNIYKQSTYNWIHESISGSQLACCAASASESN